MRREVFIVGEWRIATNSPVLHRIGGTFPLRAAA
jgi:hypothetical protein